MRDEVLDAQRLPGERHVHHRRRMALAGGEVHDAALRQQVQAAAVRAACAARPAAAPRAGPPRRGRAGRRARSRRRSARRWRAPPRPSCARSARPAARRARRSPSRTRRRAAPPRAPASPRSPPSGPPAPAGDPPRRRSPTRPTRARGARLPCPVHPYPSTTTVRPASSRLVARRIPSTVDWPVPKRSLKARSVRDSLTASTGQASAPRASSARTRSSPVVVSSVAPSIRAACSGRVAWIALTRSAPSSIVTCGPPSRCTSARTCAAIPPRALAARGEHRGAVALAQRRGYIVLSGERVGRAQPHLRARPPAARERGWRSPRSRAGRPRPAPRRAGARARSARGSGPGRASARRPTRYGPARCR